MEFYEYYMTDPSINPTRVRHYKALYTDVRKHMRRVDKKDLLLFVEAWKEDLKEDDIGIGPYFSGLVDGRFDIPRDDEFDTYFTEAGVRDDILEKYPKLKKKFVSPLYS